MRVALLYAMEGEAMPLLDKLGLLSETAPAPFRWFRGNVEELELLVACNGRDPRHGCDNIGTEAAAVNAFAVLQAFHPELVISAGTAGGLAEKGAAVGDVYLCGGPFVFHDHRVPLAGFEAYGRGGIPGHDVSALAHALGLRTAIVSSGCSLDYTERDLELLAESGATLKEMEAAAIARVCDWAKVPFFAIKAVTNPVDVRQPTPAEFLRNFDRAVAALTREVYRLLGELC